MTSQATASLSWVNTVLGAALRQGLTQEAVLAHAGIPASELQTERWPIDNITRLWRAAADLTQDSSFGLRTGRLVGPASFNVVSYILQSASTLREAISQVQKFQRLISDGGRFQIVSGDHAGWVIYHPQQGELAFSPHQIEAVLSAVVTFSRWVADVGLTPQRVQFSHAALGPVSGYRDVFHCPVDFDQAFSGMLLDNAVLDKPMPQADAQLAAVHREYAAARLAALSGPTDFEAELRQWIASNLTAGVPERATAAQALGLNDRAFARKLQQLGLSYTAVVDSVRKDAACQAVGHSTRVFVEIAQSLGFSEASAFNRAFRRWTHMDPSAWRTQALQDRFG